MALALALLLAPSDATGSALGLQNGASPAGSGTVADVIKSHPNLTSFAASLEEAASHRCLSQGYTPCTDLVSFLSAPTAFGIEGITVLAPSDAAFSALPVAAKGMFDVASLRYEFLSHHINLHARPTPNAVCAAAHYPLPGYNVTTMASQTLSILCYTCPGAQGGDACPTVTAQHTLGNATFIITATPIVASNGVVVVIDGILLPAWLPPAQTPINPSPPANNEPLVFRAVNPACASNRVGCCGADPMRGADCDFFRVCGQVDAASSVPPAIYEDEGKLKRFIDLTLQEFTMPGGLKLELGSCAEAGYTTLDPYQNKSTVQIGAHLHSEPVTVAWDNDNGVLFDYYCAADSCEQHDDTRGDDTCGCGCAIGLCPEVPPPDKPICAICNGVLNRPRVIEFFVRGSTPPPPPPPDIFGFILDALHNTPELSTLNRVVQGAATKDSRGPYERDCPRGSHSPDCSNPMEGSDGRQSFVGTIESKGPWTLFAPDNAAFDKAPALKAELLAGFRGGQNAGYLDDAFDTLYYHLLQGNFSAAQLPSGEINTLEGADITTSHLGKRFTFVTGGITSNVARVTKSIEVTNGVVHIISAVLSPPADTRPSKQQGYDTCCAAGAAGALSCCDACCKAGNIQCC